jgi:zinc and cadmium transporter
MSRETLLIFTTIILDGLAGLSGGLLSERWLLRHQPALTGFAAGAILAAVFLDILPESVRDGGPSALTWSFGGFLSLSIIEWIIGHHHHHAHFQGDRLRSPALPPSLLISDALHNIGDGAAIAAGFLISVKVGIVVAVAVIAHEVPQEVGDYAILRASDWRRGHALFALAAVQLTAFAGVGGVMIGAERIEHFTALILSIAAGTFLYIGATDLLPEIHSGTTRSSRVERMYGFLSGIAVIALVSLLAPSNIK